MTIDVTIRAIPASVFCQKVVHPKSVDVMPRFLLTRIMENAIMKRDRHRKGPIMNFCLESSWERQRIIIGMLATGFAG